MNQHENPAWIRTIAVQDASPELGAAYRRVQDPETGRLDAIMQVHGLHLPGLKAHFELYRVVMRGTPGLAAVDREMIALVVSLLNACHY